MEIETAKGKRFIVARVFHDDNKHMRYSLGLPGHELCKVSMSESILERSLICSWFPHTNRGVLPPVEWGRIGRNSWDGLA